MDKMVSLACMCEKIKPLDEAYLQMGRNHWDEIAKPLNGLGLLEGMICKIAAIQEREMISLDKRAVVVMCSDNGVVEEGVCQSDQQVTAIVAENFAKGAASVNRMAKIARVDIIPVDIGIAKDISHPGLRNCKIAYGTKNMAKEAAMSREAALEGILVGVRLAGQLKDSGYQILGTGEMGIGNTTTSSAIASVLLDLPPEQVTGKGAGLSKEGVKRKIRVIRDALSLHRPSKEDPIGVLAAVGGFDIAGLTGLFLGGAIYRIPTVIDGLISSVSALLAARICPAAVDYMLPSHMGKEPSSEKLMEALGLQPLIYGELALGEGSGTLLLFPMLDMANEVYREYHTFEQIHIPAYKKFDEEQK